MRKDVEEGFEEYKRLRDSDTDIHAFHGFFIEHGVEFSCGPGYEGSMSEEDLERLPTARHSITVSQAHFYFDKDGRFVGTIADEMGFVEPRKDYSKEKKQWKS